MNERYTIWWNEPREGAEARQIGAAATFGQAKDLGIAAHRKKPRRTVAILGEEHGASWLYLPETDRWRRVTAGIY